MSLTARPASRSARAVPPVDTSSTPKPDSTWANSTRPVLSVTLNNALRIRFSELTVALLIQDSRQPAWQFAWQVRGDQTPDYNVHRAGIPAGAMDRDGRVWRFMGDS